MMPSKIRSFVFRSLVLTVFASLIFSLQLKVANAAFADNVPIINKIAIKITVKVGADELKSPYTVAVDTPFSVSYTATGATSNQNDFANIGCVNNFASNTQNQSGSATGSLVKVAGKLPPPRQFIVTCSGVGAATTAKIQVSAGEVVLIPDTVQIGALKLKLDTDGKPKKITVVSPDGRSLNTSVYDRNARVTLAGKVRNSGKLSTSAVVKSVFQSSADKSSWADIATQNINGINSNQKVTLNQVDWIPPAGVVYVRLCAGLASTFDTTKVCSQPTTAIVFE